MIKATVTEQLGHEFVEIDVNDHANITVTHNGTPVALIRHSDRGTGINVVEWPGKTIEVAINNRPVT